MSKLDVCIYDNPVLREKARDIEVFDDRLKQLAREMAETMYASHGIGLAANQIGLTERLIVVDVDWPGREEDKIEPARNPLTMINPQILEESVEDDSYKEGCLSLPGIEGEVWRPSFIRFRYQDVNGNVHERETEGMLARCVQHEIDHLNGILFIDRILPDARKKLAGKLSALRKTKEANV